MRKTKCGSVRSQLCAKQNAEGSTCPPSLSFRKLSEPRAEPFCRRRPDGSADIRIGQRAPTQSPGGAGIHRPSRAQRRNGAAGTSSRPAAGLVASAPRPGREPSRATDSAPAARGTANALKFCAARAHRAPTFSRCEGRVDLGLRTPDFHVRNPRINCKRTRAIEQNIPDFWGFQIQNFLIFICVFFVFDS